MVVTYRHSNTTLAVLQCVSNVGCATMLVMPVDATTDLSTTLGGSAPLLAQLYAELATVRAELRSVRAEREQLHGLLADALADAVQLRVQLAQTQNHLAALEAERLETHQALVELKRKPFSTRSRSDDTTPLKPRG